MIVQQVVAGIDIGGTNTAFGLVDENGQIIFSNSVKTNDFSTADEMVAAVSREILSNLPPGITLAGVGIGAPNGNFYTGTIEDAPNLKWKGIIPLSKLFAENLNCKAILTNDANAATLGEMIFGGARGMKNFLVITLGTGLGSGIVVNGELVYGHDGFAGEIGHVIAIPDGRACGCGRKGCVETYCSANGIKKTYYEKKNIQPEAAPYISSQQIFQQAVAGDEASIDTFNYTGKILGLVLANSVAYTSPEAIFLFGGPTKAGNLLFDPTIKSFEENLLFIYKNKVKILPSQLDENNAAILGAASLIWNLTSEKNNMATSPVIK